MHLDFPDFVLQRDGNVWRVMVCNGRDEPFPLRYVAEHEDGGACAKASASVCCGADGTTRDAIGLYWNHWGDAEQAVHVARKAVGR